MNKAKLDALWAKRDIFGKLDRRNADIAEAFAAKAREGASQAAMDQGSNRAKLKAALDRIAQYCASYADCDAAFAEDDAGDLLELIGPALAHANGDDEIPIEELKALKQDGGLQFLSEKPAKDMN